MKIYTKAGDRGKTGILGGEKLWKDDIRVEAYGTVDELSSSIGLAICYLSDDSVKKELRMVQNELFSLSSDLACPMNETRVKISRINGVPVERLEAVIDRYSEIVGPFRYFVLPGGSLGASFLHQARTICRRAERRVVGLMKSVEINEKIVVYLNRLSDLLFILARLENKAQGVEDVPWLSRG